MAEAPGPNPPFGKIILLDGPSSSGKSTLAAALQAALSEPFWHYSIDHLLSAHVLPQARIDSGEFPWQSLRPNFFAGFHASVSALAAAGNNLLVEHIVENEAWLKRLAHSLSGFDVFFVGVECDLAELERREMVRGDRPLGDAKADFLATRGLCVYDFVVDSRQPLVTNVRTVISAWGLRKGPSVLGGTGPLVQSAV